MKTFLVVIKLTAEITLGLVGHFLSNKKQFGRNEFSEHFEAAQSPIKPTYYFA